MPRLALLLLALAGCADFRLSGGPGGRGPQVYLDGSPRPTCDLDRLSAIIWAHASDPAVCDAPGLRTLGYWWPQIHVTLRVAPIDCRQQGLLYHPGGTPLLAKGCWFGGNTVEIGAQWGCDADVWASELTHIIWADCKSTNNESRDASGHVTYSPDSQAFIAAVLAEYRRAP